MAAIAIHVIEFSINDEYKKKIGCGTTNNNEQQRTTAAKCNLNPAVTAATTITTAKYLIVIDVCNSKYCTDAMCYQSHVGSRIYRSMKKIQHYPITIVDSMHYPRL